MARSPNLSEQIEQLRQQAKDEQAAGDRHYWPIYNLDIKNPNAPEEETHDPDKLLVKYKTLLGEIEADAESAPRRTCRCAIPSL